MTKPKDTGPLTKQCSFRLTELQYEYLQKIAIKNKWDVAEVLRWLLEQMRQGGKVVTPQQWDALQPRRDAA